MQSRRNATGTAYVRLALKAYARAAGDAPKRMFALSGATVAVTLHPCHS